MTRRIVIRISFESEEYLQTVLKALKPETRRSPSNRSRTEIRKDDGNLRISIEATDTSALRAASNAFLRWIGLTHNVLESIDSLTVNQSEQ